MHGLIRNPQGEKLDYTFHPGAAEARVTVVLGHGVTGNKDRPFVVSLAEALSKAGLPALRFSFSGNGASEGRFEDATISKEVSDLGAVLDTLAGKTVCYVGHSMGGAVGVLRASRDARIRLVVSLAGMVRTKEFAEREFGMLTPGVGCMWDEPTCPLSQAYMDDLRGLGELLGCAPKIHAPWLLVHGTEDDVVPIADSRDIFAVANQPKKLVELPGSNHVFAGEHAAAMAGVVVEWIQAQAAKL